MYELFNKSLGVMFAGLILSTGFCLFLYDEFNREVGAVKAACWLYKALHEI